MIFDRINKINMIFGNADWLVSHFEFEPRVFLWPKDPE